MCILGPRNDPTCILLTSIGLFFPKDEVCLLIQGCLHFGWTYIVHVTTRSRFHSLPLNKIGKKKEFSCQQIFLISFYEAERLLHILRVFVFRVDSIVVWGPVMWYLLQDLTAKTIKGINFRIIVSVFAVVVYIPLINPICQLCIK